MKSCAGKTSPTRSSTQIGTLNRSASAPKPITEASERVASDKHELLPARLSKQERSVYNPQAVEPLTALLINYQNKRTELLTRYQPTDRLVLENAQQIKDTTAALANARSNNGQETTTDVNPVYQQVKSTLTASTTELVALRGRLTDLTGQRDRLRQQLSQVEGSTVDFNTLQARVTELQNNFQIYSQKKNEAQIADAMDQQQLVNVAVAERPTFSAKPYRPQVLINAALGLFTALFFGLCVVFFLELGRDTVVAPAELEAVSSVPVLATVPLTANPFAISARGNRPPGTPVRPPQPAPQPAPTAAPQTPHRSPNPASTQFAGGFAKLADVSMHGPIAELPSPIPRSVTSATAAIYPASAAAAVPSSPTPANPRHPERNWCASAPTQSKDPEAARSTSTSSPFPSTEANVPNSNTPGVSKPAADLPAMPTFATTAENFSFDHRLQPLIASFHSSFDRSQLQSFEQLETARMPKRAIHIAPIRPESPVLQPRLAPQPAVAAAPVEPVDPILSAEGRFGGILSARSRLSPSQRAAQRRRVEPARAVRNGYVTYTIDPK